MKILFFDTETTGLVVQGGDITKQPHIIQLGAILGEYEPDGKKIKEDKINMLFNPTIFIPQASTSVHGITDEMVKDKPPFISYAKEFLAITKDVDMIVGHNIEYDRNALFFEVARLRPGEIKSKYEWMHMFKLKEKCTMRHSIEFVGIKNSKGFKYPSLNDLYQKLFEKGFDGAHDAMADIEATRDCFFELVGKGIIAI